MTPPRLIRSIDPADILRAGYVVEVDHAMADELGAFEEDALTLEDVIDSNLDIEETANGKE